ncbi:hypothetical protein [Beijerinckia sp. L45]|uniref:hypothetical protein n=1 Tax=Beijerinckia sp. L45 TaxID=1641855 RepID=UPI00131BDC6E|nr:hypothetical protein [Beijerinckia sp. L45]
MSEAADDGHRSPTARGIKAVSRKYQSLTSRDVFKAPSKEYALSRIPVLKVRSDCVIVAFQAMQKLDLIGSFIQYSRMSESRTAFTGRRCKS